MDSLQLNKTWKLVDLPTGTTRKKSINDAFKVSRKSNNDASLKRHGIDCHCKYLNTLTLVTSVIILNKNIDTRKKRHNLFNLIYLL